MPLADNMRNCRAAPTAAPPGTVFDTAAPASCAVPAVNQDTSGRAIRMSHHMQTKLPISNRIITTSQGQLSRVRFGVSEKTSIKVGRKK